MATIEKRGILRHQICYLVKLSDGGTNVLKTLPAARKWAAKKEAEIAARKAVTA